MNKGPCLKQMYTKLNEICLVKFENILESVNLVVYIHVPIYIFFCNVTSNNLRVYWVLHYRFCIGGGILKNKHCHVFICLLLTDS